MGAGVGGLAAAMRLSAAGHHVTVLEKAGGPGGKMRTSPSDAGPIDIGPTVLTMRWVFEDLFRAAGTDLTDHVTLTEDTILARHWWHDGSTLDLFSDPEQSAKSVWGFAGSKGERQFRAFSNRARRLFEAFQGPMMETAQPSSMGLALRVLKTPRLIMDMAPLHTMMQSLARQFDDPRLRQLYGRYATYVGGSPFGAPALLSLIAHSEALGVWSIKGGMHALAQAMETVAQSMGVRFAYHQTVKSILTHDGKATGVQTADGNWMADCVVFNGDPAALAGGLLGQSTRRAVSKSSVEPRSLSAWVWGFQSTPNGPPLAHHNVFFGKNPKEEFDPLTQGKMPDDPTLYICAQDRGGGHIPTGPERFEIIMNGAPTHAQTATTKEKELCHQRTFHALKQHGLTFGPEPKVQALTTPADFNALFPGSQGSLYGRSPHGMTAGLKRPTARTRIRGLYLVGGGAHPGAGVPMATLSAMHVAGAIAQDQTSILPSRRTGMPGGMSTGSSPAE